LGITRRVVPLYLEDLSVGKKFVTPARTVTDADVASFAAWTGDFNPLHTDALYAAGTRFGQRIAHGLMGPTWCIGLLARLGVFDGSAIALLGVESWRFLAPVFVGDTLHCVVTVEGVRETSDGRAGVIRRRFDLIKQDGTVVQSGLMNVMVSKREMTPGTAEDRTVPAASG
jgi:acyl dehydratase